MQGSELSRGQGKDVNETLVLTYGMARHSGLGVVLIYVVRCLVTVRKYWTTRHFWYCGCGAALCAVRVECGIKNQLCY